MFQQPPGGNDPNNPNNYPRTPTDRSPRKTPNAPTKRNRLRRVAEENDADIDAIMGDTGNLNSGVTSDIISAFESTTPREDRGLFRDSKSASPISGFGFGVGMSEGRPMKRVASDPSIGDLERRARSLSVADDSGYNTPVSTSSSRSGSPNVPGAPRKPKQHPKSKGGMSRKSKKSRRSKKSRKPKKSKKTKKSKKNRKSRKSRKHK